MNYKIEAATLANDERLSKFITQSVERHLRRVAVNEEDQLSEVLSVCESPIEMYMAVALSFMGQYSLDRRMNICGEYRPDLLSEKFGARELSAATAWAVCVPQHQVSINGSDYRVDFLICYKPHHTSERFLIAVECDGHEFHEKTKEQAQRDKARDRNLAALGIVTLRFTGSEIYRDADRCASEVSNLFDVIGRKAWDGSEDAKQFKEWLIERYGNDGGGDGSAA